MKSRLFGIRLTKVKAMKIEVAKTAGFCFGVSRAVKMVEDKLDEGKKVCTFGPIIHNPVVIEGFKNRGVHITEISDDRFREIFSKSAVKRTKAEGLRRNASIIDANINKKI
jgi:4-hydroxy-3-methylbut-2-enyl diphosphate reductase IspH